MRPRPGSYTSATEPPRTSKKEVDNKSSLSGGRKTYIHFSASYSCSALSGQFQHLSTAVVIMQLLNMYSFLTYSGGITQANRNGPRAALYSPHNCKRDCVTKCVYELTMAARSREFR